MILIRECKQCGVAFKGGPRAWYCPECRKERRKATNKDARERKKAGTTREIGSTDICQNCGKEYVVSGGLQKYCEECAPLMAKEKTRQLALEYYNENKDEINPRRNLKRSVPARRCAVCGKDFKAVANKKYCSEECAQKVAEIMRPIYEKRRTEKNKQK